MAIQIGQQLGSLEVTALIGKGGMGEVYRARDTKLKRDVAIKILPDEFARDADRVNRFQREAEVLASLSHPNIAGIYDVQQTNETRFLVMELVDGETLADRIKRGPLPVEEALQIAKNICEALEAAHEKGIVHRDLKPANVKITPEGKVKVLDFGLAKMAQAQDASVLSNSPTMLSGSMPGMIVGTAAYMSPEQAKGKSVDKRADIWAFGVVLYEMLTGRALFSCETVSETMAAVMMKEPDWNVLPDSLPLSLKTYLHRCLQKDPQQRIRDIGDVRLALEGAFDTLAPQTTSPSLRARSRMRTFVTIVASGMAGSLLAALLLWLWAGRAPAQTASARVSLTIPANRPIAINGSPTRSLALSPAGTQVVYVGTNLDGPADQRGQQLELRSLATLDVRDLPGTTGARQPFFSPDGRWIGFFTVTGELKKIALSGGNPITLLSKINGSVWAFGVWTNDDRIIFGMPSSGLRQIPAEGGKATDLTKLDQGEFAHLHPALVPSNRTVLFSQGGELGTPRIEAVVLNSGKRRVVVENASAPFVLDSGYLLFQRDGVMLIAPFDTDRISITGPALPLIDQMRRDSQQNILRTPELAVSRTGTLAYLPDVETPSVLGSVSRDGVFKQLGPPPGNMMLPRVSSDGRSLAYIETRGTESELRIYDLARGSATKLGQDVFILGLAWRPDNRSLAVSSSKTGGGGIFLRDLDGTERLLVPFVNANYLRNASWSPDGTKLAYTRNTGSHSDILVLTINDKPDAEPFHNNSASEHSPRFSPDGRWLAYVSDESGRDEVYVQQYPKGERSAISTGGGTGPQWRSDGKELFYEARLPDAKLMAVTVTPAGDRLIFGKPIPLFSMQVPGTTGVTERYADSSNSGPGYDILPDGRFVMIRRPDPAAAREIVLVQNWFEELKQRVPVH